MKLIVVFLTLLGSTYAASSECSKGIYKTLVPLLKKLSTSTKVLRSKVSHLWDNDHDNETSHCGYYHGCN